MNDPFTNWALDQIEKNLDAGKLPDPYAKTFRVNRYDLRFNSWTDHQTGSIQQQVADATGILSRWLMATREKAIREGLIELGWTPPPAPPTKGDGPARPA